MEARRLESEEDQTGSPASPSGEAGPAPFRLGPWRVEPAALRMVGSGGERRLTPKAMGCLCLLAESHPEPCSRSALLDRVWGVGEGGDEALSQVIAELRRKLGDSAREARYIRTLSKTGYQLVLAPEPAGIARRVRRWLPAALAAAALFALPLAYLAMDRGAVGQGVPGLPVPEVSSIAHGPYSEVQPRESFGGSWVTYAVENPATGSFDIAIRNRDLDAPRILATPGADEFSPVLDEARDQLLYLRYRDGRCDVVRATASGERPQVIAACLGLGPATALDLSADGRFVAYTLPTDQTFLSRGLGVVRIEDGALIATRVPGESHLSYHSPRFSPDGARLLFRSFSALGPESELLLWRWDGDEVRRWQGDPSPGGADWLSDDAIAIVEDRLHLTHLASLPATLDAPARPLMLLPSARSLDVGPAGIYFTHDKLQPTSLLRLNATGEASVVVDRGEHDHSPALSPDGQRLAYASRQGEEEAIWVEDLVTGAARPVASLGTARVSGMAWNPRGDELAVTLSRSDGPGLYAVGLDGTVTELRHGCGHAVRPQFGPHDGALYVMGYRGGIGNALCRLGDAGSTVVLDSGVLSYGFDGAGRPVVGHVADPSWRYADTGKSAPQGLQLGTVPLRSWDTSAWGVAMLWEAHRGGPWSVRLRAWGEADWREHPLALSPAARSAIDLDAAGRLIVATDPAASNSDILFVPRPAP